MENDNSAMWASMLNGGQWMNNPWIYFVFLALFGRNGGLFGNNGAADASLAQTIADNHNSDLLMDAVKGNSQAAQNLATNLNVGVDTINAAICGLRSALDSCCCSNKLETQRMGYESQISNLQQTNSLLGRIDQLANGIQTGFVQVGYATQAQTCELKTNQNENTQRILDTLNGHWQADLTQKLNEAKLELSQLQQNATLIAALKTTTTSSS
jgi:hypothetical protein